MDDKENKRSSSKIPIPLAPLPPLKSVGTKMAPKARKPLSTVGNDQWVTIRNKFRPSPTPSKSKRTHQPTPYKSIKLHRATPQLSKNVTLRQSDEDLDWNLDELKNCKVCDKNGDNKVVQCLEINNNIDPSSNEQAPTKSSTAITPGDSSRTLTVKQIKNIKRSLKRPHSRELMGVTPTAKKRLVFSENSLTQNGGSDQLLFCCDLPEDLKQSIVDHLLITENKLDKSPLITSISRSCITNWLLKVNITNSPNGDSQIFETACWLLDSTLTKGRAHIERQQLVACACYWLARKHIGPPCTATYMVKLSNNAFSTTDLAEAEYLLLKVLKWPSPPITPSDYMGFFKLWLGPLLCTEIELAANYLILCSLIIDVNFYCEFPSVIAAAAFKNAGFLLDNKLLLVELEKSYLYQVAQLKTASFSYMCSIQRISVRKMSNPSFVYRTAYDIFSGPPYHIAERIVKATAKYFKTDIINVKRFRDGESP